MGQPLSIGLLGAGQRGTLRAETLVRLGEGRSVRLVGVHDTVPERAERLAEQCRTQAFPSAAALLDASDAVCVAAPTMDHFVIGRAALAGGRSVFLEWPPTTSLDEAERLARHAEEAGTEVGVARPLPDAALLAGVPDDWRPRLLSLSLTIGPDDALAALPWPHRLAGVVGLLSSLARSRDATRVEAEADRGPGVALRAVAFSLRFRRGAYAQALIRETAHAPEGSFRLDASGQGLHGAAHDLDGPLCLERDGANPIPAAALDPALRPADYDLAAFLAAIAAGRPAPVSILDGLHTMRLVERLMARLR